MLNPALQNLTEIQLTATNIILQTFNIEGLRADIALSNGQKIIFYNLVFRPHTRLQIICSTQYGKSLVVALACVIISCVQREVVAVVAPSNEKSKLIMRYYIQHLGDNVAYARKLEKNTRLERLKQEESKNRIILNNGGGIFTVSTQERNSTKSVESAMGLGARIVIGDEYCLVSDNNEATILRMGAGKGANFFYCKIGNPFYSAEPYSHFKLSWEDETYAKIFIDYKVALEEGRYEQALIDEARKKPLFEILFECKFPPEDEISQDGFQQLVTASQVTFKPIEEVRRLLNDYLEDCKAKGIKPLPLKLGADIGAGSDRSIFTLRRGRFAYVVATGNSKDTMSNVTIIQQLMEDFPDLLAENIAIDDIGVGRGVYDRLIELGIGVNGVSVGEPAIDNGTFANLKAELSWFVKNWCLDGGVIDDNIGNHQIFWIRWKNQTGERKIICEPKENVRKRHKKSPDYFDALMLTFYEAPFIGFF